MIGTALMFWTPLASVRDAVQDDGQVLAGDVVDAELAARPVPTHAHPYGVAQEPVGQLDVEIGAEAAVLDAGPEHVVPHPAELGEPLRDVREAGLGRQPSCLGLVDR